MPMPGLRFHLEILSRRFSVIVPGLAALWIALWVQLAGHQQTTEAWTRTGIRALAAGVIAVSLLAGIELLIHFIAPAGKPVGFTRFSVTGSSSLRRRPAAGHDWRQAAVSMAVLSIAAAILLAMAGRLADMPDDVPGVTYVALLFAGGCMLVRLCPIQGFPGGNLANWYLALLAEDDDSAETAARGLSYLSAAVVTLTGGLMLSAPGWWGAWGLAVLAAGVDCLMLTQWHCARGRWIEKAACRSLDDIASSKLPSISQSAQIAELFSIFAVEGSKATVVVLDNAGQPSGIIHLRQLRSLTRTSGSTQPRELMITLADLPQLPSTTSILDAALFLEQHNGTALVSRTPSGKLRVLSLDELQHTFD